MIKKFFPPLFILLIALAFRFYQLTEYPVHLSMDEAAIVYNAYSIAETGKDEWNETLPLAFKSAGDYKPPVNVYLTAPITKIFGLSKFSARFISAFLGSLTVVVVFYLLLELNFSRLSSFFTSFWLGILPWHIHFSRGSFESITALFFFFLGLLFFLRWLKKVSPSFLILFLISFSLSVWSYHAERFFVPIVAIILGIIYFQPLLKSLQKTSKVTLTASVLIALFFIIPFLKLALFTPAVSTRALSTSILRDPDLSRTLMSHYTSFNQFVFQNNLYKIFTFWFNRYLEYFDLRFIFWKAMFNPPQYLDVGILFLTDIIFVALGFFRLLTSKDASLKKLFLALFLLGPIPASLAMNPQHPLRALIWLPSFTILMAAGFEAFFKKRHLFKYVFVFIAYFVSSLYFINIYQNLFPHFQSEYWQYGYEQAAKYVCQHHQEYQNVIVSDTFGSNGPLNTGLPYLYVLLECKFSPFEFQQFKKTGNIDYRRFDVKHDPRRQSLLVVASPWDVLDYSIPPQNIMQQIYFKNGKKAFIIFKTP